MTFRSGGPGFQPTRWSIVLQARDAGTVDRPEALDALCALYWRPIYVYLRRRGRKPAEAQDLTQGFFAHFLEKGLLDRVEKGRGRFKTYLLTVLENYLANESRMRRAAKRGGGRSPLSLDFATAESLVGRSEETPEIAFDRSWAWSVLDAALSRLASEYEGRGETAIFEALRDHLLASRRSSQAELATSLGCGTEEIRRHLRRARSDLRAQLLGQLMDTVEDPADLDREVQEFLGYFGPARPDLTERK